MEMMPDRIKFILFAHRTLHMGFQLVSKLVTSNGVMALILRYFADFGSFGRQLHQ